MILESFIQSFEPKKHFLDKLLAENKLLEAKRFVHSTKAAGGYLGAHQLTNLANELEKDLSNHDGFAVKTVPFTLELEKVITSVKLKISVLG